MHPRHHVPKTYEVWIRGVPVPQTINQWQTGVILEGKRTHPATVNILKVDRDNKNPHTQLQIILSEGRNRQIRKVAELLGHPVLSLHRIAIASVSLAHLKVGAYRLLNDDEIKTLGSISL
jgi:pseudouridine synthase